jgi:type II secretory pathway component PulJ
MRRSSAETHGAFTLLEVLISSAILLGLLVLLLGASEGTTRFWNQSERRRAPLCEAGASLRFMARDLRSAVITSDSSSLVIRKGTNGNDSLFFLVSHPTDHQPGNAIGDLCATGYFIAPSPQNHDEQDLYRFHASGELVLEAVEEQKLPELFATASLGTTSTELLARHVISLEVLPIDSGSAPDHPRALELTIMTLDGSAERKLAGAGTNMVSRDRLLKQYGTRLSMIVALPPLRSESVHP